MNTELTFNHVVDTVKKLILLNMIFLLIMSLYRVLFFFYYGNMSELSGMVVDVARAFFLGVRFDLAILAYINLLVTLSLYVVWLLGKQNVFIVWQKVVRIYYTLMFAVVALVLIFDFGFYMYFKSHINIIIFGIFEDDTKALAVSIWKNYGLIICLLTAAFLVFIFWIYNLAGKFIKEIQTDTAKKYQGFVKILFAVMLLPLNFLAARGSFNLFPLGVMDAEISSNAFINKLSVTGVHTLQEALEFRMKENKGYDLIKETGYENNIEDAFALFLNMDKRLLSTENLAVNLIKKTVPNQVLEKNKPNVVLIMMEGFGSDLMKYNSERFNVLGELKKHFDSGYLFKNFLSGDVGTIGSIETAIFNIPKRPNAKPITQSRYAYGDHASGGAIPFKNSGYETTFLYGGNANWRNMMTIMPSLGFDVVEGEGSMDKNYQRNEWGVYDEFLFEEIYRKISKNSNKPQFIFAMTTTNHPPYSLPSAYKPLPLEIPEILLKRITGNRKLAKERFETYQYSAQKAGELITKIINSPLRDNTIIAVTGDHNFWDVFSYTVEETLDLYSVPFYIYVPKNLRPFKADTNVFGSHMDMLPTLYNLSLSKSSYVSIGSDLFNCVPDHPASNVDGFIMDNTAVSRYSVSSKTQSFYLWNKNLPGKITASAMTKRHKEQIEYYKAELAVTEYFIKHPFKLPEK